MVPAMTDIIWNKGNPPKRGAYLVKSDGPSANVGYRYWFGEHWGPLCQKRRNATAANQARKVTLQRPVLWASKAPPPADPIEDLLELLRKACHHLTEHNKDYHHRTPASLLAEIKKAIEP